MAQSQRTRIVANRAGKRKKARRNMTAKQIRFFGTKAQRAALRGSRKKSHRRRHNAAGEIIGYTLAKGSQRRANMAKANRKRPKRKGSSGYRARSRKTKHNPARRSHSHRVHHRRTHRRNAASGPTQGGIMHIATNAVFVIAGALGSKLLAQMVLGSNNVGLLGYGGNAIAGGLLWFLADKVMKNRVAANGVIAGTAVQIILRLINDYTPFGQYVSQLGMGDYQAQAFVTPQVLVDPYNSAQIRFPAGMLPAPAPAAAAAGTGMGSLYAGGSSLY